MSSINPGRTICGDPTKRKSILRSGHFISPCIASRVSIYTTQNVASRIQKKISCRPFGQRKLKFLFTGRNVSYRLTNFDYCLGPQGGSFMAKVVQFHEKGGPEVLKLEEMPLLPVAENDVRFRVHTIGLNRAESMYRKGAYLQD